MSDDYFSDIPAPEKEDKINLDELLDEFNEIPDVREGDFETMPLFDDHEEGGFDDAIEF